MFCQELVVLTMKTPQYHFQDYVQITLQSLLIKKDQPGLSSNVYSCPLEFLHKSLRSFISLTFLSTVKPFKT